MKKPIFIYTVLTYSILCSHNAHCQIFIGGSIGANFEKLSDHEKFSYVDVYGNSYNHYEPDERYWQYGGFVQFGERWMVWRPGFYFMRAGPVGRDITKVEQQIGDVSTGSIEDFVAQYVSVQFDIIIRPLPSRQSVMNPWGQKMDYIFPILPYIFFAPEVHYRLKDPKIKSASASRRYEGDLKRIIKAASIGAGLQFNPFPSPGPSFFIEGRYGLGRSALTDSRFEFGGANTETLWTVRGGTAIWF